MSALVRSNSEVLGSHTYKTEKGATIYTKQIRSQAFFDESGKIKCTLFGHPLSPIDIHYLKQMTPECIFTTARKYLKIGIPANAAPKNDKTHYGVDITDLDYGDAYLTSDKYVLSIQDCALTWDSDPDQYMTNPHTNAPLSEMDQQKLSQFKCIQDLKNEKSHVELYTRTTCA